MVKRPARKTSGINNRGKPEAGSLVHMHWTQNRPGLKEGWDIGTCDYMVNVLCKTGGFHIFMVWDEHDGKGGFKAEKLVTCPKCLAIMANGGDPDNQPKQLDPSLDHLIYDGSHQTPRID